MKSLKVVVSVLVLGVATPALTFAADGGGKGGRGGGMSVERLEQAVGTLSADQKTKIEAILAKSREAAQAAQGDQDKMREVFTKQRSDIRAVLTPEQQKKFDEMPQGGRGGKKKN